MNPSNSKSTLWRLSCTILVMFVGALFSMRTATPALAQSDGVSFELSPSTSTVNPGDSFQVVVKVTTPGSQQVDLAEIHLDFDPTILQVAGVQEISPLDSALQSAAFDNSAGTVDAAYGTFSNFPSAPFDFLTIDFTAVAAGTTALDFSSTFPRETIATFDGDNVTNSALDGSVTVQAAQNQNPIANAGPDQTVEDSDNSGDETVTLDGSASSDDGTITSYVWSEDGNQIATGAAPQVTLDVGTHDITLTVTDNDNNTDTDTVTVVVEPFVASEDVEFVIDPSTSTVVEGNTFSVDVLLQAGSQPVDTAEVHLNFDPTILQVQSITPGAFPSGLQNQFDNTNGTIDYAAGALENPPSGTVTVLTVEFSAGAVGSSDLTFVFDGPFRETQALFSGDFVLDGAVDGSVTVEDDTNPVPPVADAGPDQTVEDSDNNGSEPVTLDGSGSTDSDGQIVSYEWSEGGNVLSTDANPTLNFDVGTHIVTLTVTDNDNNTDTDTVSITVNSPVQTDDVFLVVDPALSEVAIGQTFDVVVQVQAGTQPVDAVEIHLDFDETKLQVQSLTPNASELPTVLINPAFDNNTGQVDYAAGTFAPFPSGTFDVLTITFEAVAETNGTQLSFASVFPRETQVTFDGNSVLTDVTPGTVVVEVLAQLNGSVTLQGREPAPNAAWSVPLTVKLYESGQTAPSYTFNPTTDTSGQFTVNGIVPGTYDVEIKNVHTLQNVQSVTLVAGPNPTVDFGTLLEGDANNDNTVTLTDFSILAATFNLAIGDPGYDERADFNENDFVTLQDFSLLSTNFNTMGASVGTGGAANAVVAPESTRKTVVMRAQPGAKAAETDETFAVQLYLETGEQFIDAAGAALHFDPNVLQVLSVEGSSDLDTILDTTHDNAAGVLVHEAGRLGEALNGRVELALVRFQRVGESERTEFTFGEGTSAYRSGIDVLQKAVNEVLLMEDAPVRMDFQLFLPLLRE